MTREVADRAVRVYRESDREAIVDLWSRCGLLRPWNDPRQDIARKVVHDPDGFLVLETGIPRSTVGAVMVGYDGHRGWVNYLAVSPEHRGLGLGRLLMDAAEERLRSLGCPKLNLQVRADNDAVIDFYRHLGYSIDNVANLGKRFIVDQPSVASDGRPPADAQDGRGRSPTAGSTR